MDKKYCVHCGRELKMAARFCGKCGMECDDVDNIGKVDMLDEEVPQRKADKFETQHSEKPSRQTKISDLETVPPDAIQPAIITLHEGGSKSISKSVKTKNIVIATLSVILVLLVVATVIIVFEPSPFNNQDANVNLLNEERLQVKADLYEPELSYTEETLIAPPTDLLEDYDPDNQHIIGTDEDQYQQETDDLVQDTPPEPEPLPVVDIPNEFIGMFPEFLTNSVHVNPSRVWFEGDYLFAEMFITNGIAGNVFNIHIDLIRLSNHEGVIAEASFGLMEGAMIGRNNYIVWTFVFSPEQIFIPNADLTGFLRTESSSSYMW